MNLTRSELYQLLITNNQTQTEYPRQACIHELFEQQVAQTPEAVALIFQEEKLTYRELNSRANQLAHHLQALGVGVETLVGISVERSFDLVIGLLAILKVGGAYVPLDPTYPQARLAWILEDTQVSVLLTQSHLVKVFSELSAMQSLQLIGLDQADLLVALNTLSDDNLVNLGTAENLAYVMYTSGSTGQPKGVSVIHRGVVRLVKNTHYAKLTADEVLLQLAPLSFDASTFEIWGALLNGAKLVIMPPAPPSLAELGAALQRYQITTLWLTAGLFHQMVNERLTDLQNLRQLLAGGEALAVPQVNQVLSILKTGSVLINGYGPTENTTFSCCYSMLAGSQVTTETVPIGRPISNSQAYVLDEQLQPVPRGAVGELYVGGDGLARGYFNRPALTAEKFIQVRFDNFSKVVKSYKTGDLVRYRPDGVLEFLGRRDHQIKLRGFRIEPGEIEATLQQFPEVQLALVMVKELAPGDKRLMAYVVVTPAALHQEDFTPQLRQFLVARLPNYLLPAAIIKMATFPTTANGKVDREALPLPTWRGSEATEDLPRSTTEMQLSNLFAHLLKISSVGIYDNFFELGGDSLLATQLLARICELFQVELSIATLFQAPTVMALAELIQAHKIKLSEELPAISPVPRYENLPLSFTQQQLWLGVQLAPTLPIYNEPLTLHLGPIKVNILEQSLTEIVRRHAALRTVFHMVDGQPVQSTLPPPTLIPLPVTDLSPLSSSQREAEALNLATQAAKRSFDLTKDLLLRAMLIRFTEEDYRLYLTLHHIVFDGISFYTILLQELETLYRALAQGQSSPWLEPTWQYPDFAVWQRQWLSPELLAPQLTYWQQQLANLPVLKLPTDHFRPVQPTFQGAMHVFSWSKDLTEALKTLSRHAGVTLYMTILAAFTALLHRYTGQTDIVIGTVKANRYRPEWESLCGLFLNTLVLRTDCSGDPSFQELLQRVREVTVAAYAHQELPFESLVEALRPTRVAGANPLFQVTFTLDPPLSTSELDWTLQHFEVHTGTAKFDLTLELDERATGIMGRWEYSTDLFEAATIARLTSHLQNLLEGIVIQPTQRLSELPLWLKAEATSLSSRSLVATQALSQTWGEQKNLVAPSDAIEQQLAGLWEKLLNVHPIGRQDNFFELGGHSLLALTLLEQIEKTFGKKLRLISLFQSPTLAKLATLLREPQELSHLSKLRRALEAIQPQGESPPFFFIGSTKYARALAPHLGADQPVYGLNIFGMPCYHQDSVPLTIQQVATHYLQEIQGVQPHGPYFLGGYCGDAMVALELAQQFQVRGETIALLVFIDVVLESGPDYLHHWHNLLEFGPRYLLHKIRQRGYFTQTQLAWWWSKLKQQVYRRPIEKLSQRTQDTLFIQAFYHALEEYQPQPYSGKITLFLCQEWRRLGIGRLQQLAAGGVECYEVLGYHDNLFIAPQINTLGQQLQECLRKPI